MNFEGSSAYLVERVLLVHRFISSLIQQFNKNVGQVHCHVSRTGELLNGRTGKLKKSIPLSLPENHFEETEKEISIEDIETFENRFDV